ncbi:hypothetical protein JCM16303_001093 [Sporobolomyces ruberrimus]
MSPADETLAPPTSSRGGNFSTIYRDALIKIGPLTPSTWPQWAELLPKMAGDMANVPVPDFYLDGKIPRPDYANDSIIKMVTTNDKKGLAEYTKWTRLTEALKTAVITYGGADAGARVEGFDTRFGDAVELWSTLSKGYGETDTGSEKVTMVTRMLNNHWAEGTESPAIYFTRIRNLQARINSAYRADARRSTVENDHVKADRLVALSDFFLRDIAISRLPETYADNLLHSIKRDTTFDDLRQLVVSLHASREAQVEIQEIEARRTTGGTPTQEKSSRPPPAKRSFGTSKGNSGGKRMPKMSRESVTKYYGYNRWRGGTFTEPDGRVRFKILRGTCFVCFKEGHMARECKLEKGLTEAANSRIAEMKKNGITIPLEEASALRTANWTEDGPTDPDELSALRAFHAAHSHGEVVESNIDAESFFCSTIDSPDNPPLESPALEVDEKVLALATRTKNVAVLDSGATRHFCCDIDLLTDYKAYPDGPKRINGVFDTLGQGLGEGTMTLDCGSSRSIRLGRVMYAPKLGVNLISQTRMMLSGFRFTNTSTLLSLYSST